MTKMNWDIWDKISQVGLPVFTATGFLLTALKLPEYGLLINLFSQVFWIPSSYRSWKHAGQIGIFVATVIIATIIVLGVINYWIL
jgi:hypothetical protein